MKKLAACLLLLVYFTVTTGFVVSVHYCMNKLASVELGYDGHGECGKCGMKIEKSDGCCKDDVRLVKMQADQNLAKAGVPDFSLALAALNPTDFYSSSFLSSAQSKNCPLAHDPPLYGRDIYLRHCVFRL